MSDVMATRRTDDEAAIRQQIDQLTEAIRVHDLEGLKRLYTTETVSFDVQPPLQHLGVEAKANNWIDVFATFQRPLNYEVREFTVTVGGDVAFGHGLNRLSGTFQDGTVTNGFWVRFTACFRRIGGSWLIAHDHVSIPLDFPSGKARLDLKP